MSELSTVISGTEPAAAVASSAPAHTPAPAPAPHTEDPLTIEQIRRTYNQSYVYSNNFIDVHGGALPGQPTGAVIRVIPVFVAHGTASAFLWIPGKSQLVHVGFYKRIVDTKGFMQSIVDTPNHICQQLDDLFRQVFMSS